MGGEHVMSTTFDIRNSELESASQGMKKSGESLHDLFEDYASAYLKSAGVAYEEGTSVYEALHSAVEQAVSEAEAAVSEFTTQSEKAMTTAENSRETETKSVNQINNIMG